MDGGVRFKWNSMSRSVVDRIQIAGVGWSLDPVSTSVDYLRDRFLSGDLGLSWRVLLDDTHPVLYSQTFLSLLLIYTKGYGVDITQKF